MTAGEVERAAGADRVDVHRLERHREVLGRAGGAGEVEHAVDASRDRQAVDDVGDDQLEVGALDEVRDVVAPAGCEVVDRDDLVAPFEQRLAQVRADEPGATSHDDPTHRRPTPVYSYPRRRIAAGSSRLRASTTAGLRMRARSRSKSSQRNSSHSVSSATTSTPVAAS